MDGAFLHEIIARTKVMQAESAAAVGRVRRDVGFCQATTGALLLLELVRWSGAAWSLWWLLLPIAAFSVYLTGGKEIAKFEESLAPPLSGEYVSTDAMMDDLRRKWRHEERQRQREDREEIAAAGD